MEPWVVIAVVISSVMSNHVPLPYRTFDFVEISSRAVSLEESRLRTQFKPFSGNDSFVSQPIWPGNQALQAHAFYMTHTIYIVLQPTINTPCEMDNLNTNYHTNGIASCELPRDQEGGSNAVPRKWIDVANQGDDFEAKSIDYWRNRWLIIVDVYRDYIDICVGYLCRYGLMILLAFVAILTRLRANAFEYNHRTMQSILFLTFAAILPPTLFAWEDGGEDVHSIIGHEYDSHSIYLDPFTLTDLASSAAKPYPIGLQSAFDFQDLSAYSLLMESSLHTVSLEESMALSAADSLVLHRDTRASCMDHGFVEVSADNNGGLWCDLAYNEARRALAQYDEAMLMMTLKKTPFIPTIAQASSPPERALRPSTDSVSPGATNAPHGRDNLDLRRHANATRANEFARHIHTIPHQTQSIIPLSSDATSTGKSRGLTWQTIIQYMRHLEQPSPFDANSFSSNLPDYAHTKHEKCTKKYVESQVNWEEAPPIFDANIFAFLVVMVLISATKSTHRLLMALFWLNFTACKAYESAPKKLGPYYVYESAPKKWNDAESYCQTTYGTHLATIWDDQAADELVTLFQTGGRLWIGLNDKDVEGKWVYAGDGTGTFWWRLCGLNCDWIKYWADGQPSNSDGAEDCGQVFQANRDSMVNDDRCEKTYPFACNKPKPFYVYESAEKNWDEAEAYCQTTYGTHLATIWNDEAAEELMILSEISDWFWMGLNDKDVEGTWVYVDGSADSLCGGDCGSNQDYKYWDSNQPNGGGDCGATTGDQDISSMLHDYSCTQKLPFACNKPKYYVFGIAEKNWNDAEAYCQTTYGTHLATIWNDEAAEELMTLSHMLDFFWIGLNDKDEEGTWVYTDGSSNSLCGGDCASIKYWIDGQPDDWHQNEHCGHVKPHSFDDISSMINDIGCTRSFPFACNKPKTWHYVYESAPKKWNDAEAYCQSAYGTHLATIWHDQAAVDLLTLALQFSSDDFWIGLNDISDEGTWVYEDGSADSLCGGDCGSNQNYKYWDYGQPNKYWDCGIVRPDNPGISSMLHDDSCTKSLPFACNNPKFFRINEVITITGDGFDAETERFSVKFQVNSDIAFNYGTRCDEQVVVRNTKENGQWQTEER
eukprot:579523_1